MKDEQSLCSQRKPLRPKFFHAGFQSIPYYLAHYSIHRGNFRPHSMLIDSLFRATDSAIAIVRKSDSKSTDYPDVNEQPKIEFSVVKFSYELRTLPSEIYSKSLILEADDSFITASTSHAKYVRIAFSGVRLLGVLQDISCLLVSSVSLSISIPTNIELYIRVNSLNRHIGFDVCVLH